MKNRHLSRVQVRKYKCYTNIISFFIFRKRKKKYFSAQYVQIENSFKFIIFFFFSKKTIFLSYMNDSVLNLILVLVFLIFFLPILKKNLVRKAKEQKKKNLWTQIIIMNNIIYVDDKITWFFTRTKNGKKSSKSKLVFEHFPFQFNVYTSG